MRSRGAEAGDGARGVGLEALSSLPSQGRAGRLKGEGS